MTMDISIRTHMWQLYQEILEHNENMTESKISPYLNRMNNILRPSGINYSGDIHNEVAILLNQLKSAAEKEKASRVADHCTTVIGHIEKLMPPKKTHQTTDKTVECFIVQRSKSNSLESWETLIKNLLQQLYTILPSAPAFSVKDDIHARNAFNDHTLLASAFIAFKLNPSELKQLPAVPGRPLRYFVDRALKLTHDDILRIELKNPNATYTLNKNGRLTPLTDNHQPELKGRREGG